MLHAPNRLLSSHRNKRNLAICHPVDQTEEHCVKKKSQALKDKYSLTALNDEAKEVDLRGVENGMGDQRG